MELTHADKSILLASARQSILSIFRETSIPELEYDLHPNLSQNCGAFVTLTIENKLRGCIGYIVSEMPLFETVIEAAKQAAFYDPRFNPVELFELDNINIEISVLSPLKEIKDYSEINIGQDGLLLDEKNRAVLLPQVASENNYDVPAFLTALCHKAGINRNEWQRRNLNLKTFTSNYFSEFERKEHTI